VTEQMTLQLSAATPSQHDAPCRPTDRQAKLSIGSSRLRSA
jgi:hypothetical protein